ncbi:MAG: hypothetical protein ABJP45_15825 [Cyclobacteriaceae bacterium]
MSKKSFSGTSKSDEEVKPSSFIESFLPDQTEKEVKLKKQAKPTGKKNESLTRQTFMIKKSVLNRLKNFVHSKRKYEDYNYSQRRALEEALEMLFKTINIEERGT